MNSTGPATSSDRSALRKADWSDFRDHLTTADKEGRRQWLYPRKPSGRYTRARTWLSWFLLAVMFAGPFIRIDGEPLFLANIVERKFVVLGQVFWPQDGIILAVGLLVFFTGIAVFTAAFGRLWCGWTCPQTVLMEMVFRKIEYAIEGDSHQQRALSKAPWTPGKIIRKGGKHLIFLSLSFLVGNTLLAYIIGTEQLIEIITDHPANHVTGLSFMLLFTLVFYLIFARFREQACTFICPYGRLQSTLLDENTVVVAYDHKRGEKRAPLRRGQTPEQRQAENYGDCISCRQCVSVCPTGIDIRDGTQMECVHCTACIDACDAVMLKTGRAPGLIRYASQNGIERGERLRLTPRMIGYSLILAGLIGLEIFLVFTRSDVQTTFLRAPGALFQQMPDGHFSNLYTVKVVNKTSRPMPIDFRIENLPGEVFIMGAAEFLVPPKQLRETPVLVELDVSIMQPGRTPLVIGVYSDGRKLSTLKTSFVGPRSSQHTSSETSRRAPASGVVAADDSTPPSIPANSPLL